VDEGQQGRAMAAQRVREMQLLVQETLPPKEKMSLLQV